MEGCKLDFAKKAVQKIIKHTQPNDILHFIIYDDKSEVVFRQGNLRNKDSLVSMVQRVVTGGSTDIALGLQTALSVLDGIELTTIQTHTTNEGNLKDLPQAKENAHLRRIFLFSDGLTNAGRHQSKEALRCLVHDIHERGITVGPH